MLQALVVLCYCGYQDGIKKDQWRTARMSVLTPAPDSVKQVRGAMLWSPRRSVWQQALTLRLNERSVHQFATRIYITVHTKSKLLRNLVNRTRWSYYSFVMNSWTSWETNAT
jgi:hypothetical protein